MNSKDYDDDLRAEALKIHRENGFNLERTAAQIGISITRIAQWQSQQMGSAPPADHAESIGESILFEIRAIIFEIGKKREIASYSDLIKALAALSAVSANLKIEENEAGPAAKIDEIADAEMESIRAQARAWDENGKRIRKSN